MTNCALGIFAKEPLPGRVKTRLCPPLTPEQAARLYQTSMEETIAAQAGLSAEPVIFYEGDPDFFRQHFPQLQLIPQGPGDLGRRMDRAFRYLFEKGVSAAALIGTDSPDLPPRLISKAFSALLQHDLVVIPAGDGGYVLIGERVHRPELFLDIPWSTVEVWPTTRQTAENLGICCHVVGSWDDLDNADDLIRLIHRSPTSRTARLARRMLEPVMTLEEAMPGKDVDLRTDVTDNRSEL
jgi:rSAM/selenodomain-associated transferase 1